MGKIKIFAGICAFLMIGSLAAQVSVDLALAQHNYMQYEPIYAKVRLRNYSGKPLVFGKDAKLSGELLLEVEYNRRLIQPVNTGDMSLIGTVLMPGQTLEFIIPVNRYYKLTRPGKYHIHAYVRHAMLKDMFRSRDCVLDVVKGVEVWRRTVGVPDVLNGAPQTPSQSQSRTFVLRILEENAVKYFYVIIEDSKKVYAVTRMGREVNSENYSAEIDMLSRMHLVVPLASKLYRYAVINQDGKIERQQILKAGKTKPGLLRNPDNGEVRCVGGTEALPGIDYKAPEKIEKHD